jgi:hypothetical protein
MNNQENAGNLENKVGIKIPHDAQARMDQLKRFVEGDYNSQDNGNLSQKNLEDNNYGYIKK